MPRTNAKSAPSASFDNVVHDLELDIVLGRMRPRERLIEDELMLRFGAKRHVVRSAIVEVERRGLVERRQNQGARVRDYSKDEVRALYAFRADLHKLAVSRMTLPLPETVTRELTALAEAHELACQRADLAQVIEFNNAFHDLLFDQCGNPFISETVRRMAAASNAIRSYRIGDADLLHQAAQEHREMIAASRAGNRDVLSSLCVAHILPSLELYLRDNTR